MDEHTLNALRSLKEMTDARLEMERQGLLTPVQLKRKIVIEEQMKYQIANCMRDRQVKINEKKKEEEKMVGQLTYKLRRKLREMDRLREEEEYRQKVEERYVAQLKKEKEEDEKKMVELEELLKEKKELDEKIQENGVSAPPSTINKKNRKNRQKNKKASANDDTKECEVKMESLSL